MPLTQAQADALSWLAGELGRWSARINLTAILDPIEMADKHILDSLTVLRALEADTTTLLDAALERLPGPATGRGPADLSVTLVDAVGRRSAF
jgi:16S rRNA (guanine527-N7)-methyltransferase